MESSLAKQSDVLVEGAMRTFALTRRYSSERAKLDSIQELAPETRFIYDGWGSGWYHDFDYVLSYRKDRDEFVLGHPDHEQDIIDTLARPNLTGIGEKEREPRAVGEHQGHFEIEDGVVARITICTGAPGSGEIHAEARIGGDRIQRRLRGRDRLSRGD
ncbi:MAG: hypothetical protein AAFP18_18805, partial [Bacteroidota bacterium]